MSKFKQQVIKVVSFIPFGKVVSYGQVALYVGMPRAARQVGWILNGLESPSTPFGRSGQGITLEIPWWRVVNNAGRISIKASKYLALDQKMLLEKEGIKVANDLTFEINKYRFIPDTSFITKLQLDPIYLEMIADKIPYSDNPLASTSHKVQK